MRTRAVVAIVGVVVLAIGGFFVVRTLGDDDRSCAIAPTSELGSASATGRSESGGSAATTAEVPRSLRALGTGSGSSSSTDGGDSAMAVENVGVDGPPNGLAKIPDRYELGGETGYSSINLAGGRSELTTPMATPAPATARTVRGVVTRNGQPAVGAVVVLGDDFRVWAGHLIGGAGAVTDTRGRFVISNAPTTELRALALHATGWSQPTSVANDEVSLVLGGGVLNGKATYDGKAESFAIHARRDDLDIGTESLPDGTFSIGLLPVGTYEVSIGLAQSIAGGASKLEKRTITIKDGATTTIDVAMVAGTTIVVTAQLPAGSEASYVDFILFPGATVPADGTAARNRQRAEHVQSQGYGGTDLTAPMQFHDVAAGSYVVCAIGDFREPTPFGCTAVNVRETDDVREIAIQLK